MIPVRSVLLRGEECSSPKLY